MLPKSGTLKHELTPEQTNEMLQLQLDTALFSLPDMIGLWPLNPHGEYKLYLKQQTIQQKIDVEPQQQVVMSDAIGKHQSLLNPGHYQVEHLSDAELDWLHKIISTLIVGAMSIDSDIRQILINIQKRKFVLDFIKQGKFYVKEYKGVPFVIFMGNPKLRSTIRGTR